MGTTTVEVTARPPSSPAGRGRRPPAPAVLPGVALAVALTAWRSGAKPLWRDEWYTFSTAHRSLPDVLGLVSTSQDVGLAGYYSAMHLWLLAGTGEAWLRLPSALGTVALVAATAAVALRVAGRSAAVVAGLLVAVLPEVVGHAQEARPYPLVLAGVAGTVWLALRWRERPSPGRAWALALVSAVPGTLHPIAGLPAVAGVYAAMLVWPGAARRRAVVTTSLPAAVSGGALVVAGLLVAAGQSSGPPPTPADLPALAVSLAGSWWLALLAGALVAVGAVALRRTGEPAGALPPGADPAPGAAPVLLGALVAPFAVVGAMGLANWFYALRYVSAASVPVAVLVAVGAVAAVRRVPRPGAGLLAAALTAVLLVPLLGQAAASRQAPYVVDDPRAAALALAAQHRPGDAVVYDGTTSRGLVGHYLPPGSGVTDTLLAATPLAAGTIYGANLRGARARAVLTTHRRLWITGTIGGSGTWNSPRAATAWEAGRVLVEHRTFGRWWLELWVRPR